MCQALYASHNELLYRCEPTSMLDIAELIGEPPHRIESLTSADGVFVFWFGTKPGTRVNRTATTKLLVTTGLNARHVPLLRNNVVISSHTSAGQLAGLSDEQLDHLVHATPTGHQAWILDHRLRRDLRAQRAQAHQRTAALLRPHH